MQNEGRILLQDDDEVIREIIPFMLTSAGHKCLTAETPRETLATLNSEDIDVVICGVLEWLEGDEFGRMLKDFPDIPVIVCSGMPRKSALPALKAGAYDFLQKPFERDALISVVDRALEYRRQKLANQNVKE